MGFLSQWLQSPFASITFHPVQADSSTAAELAFLLAHKFCHYQWYIHLPQLCFHPSLPEIMDNSNAFSNVYLKFLSWWLNLQSKFRVTKEAYSVGGFGDPRCHLFHNLRGSLTRNMDTSIFFTVYHSGNFGLYAHPSCAKQTLLPPGFKVEPSNPLCAYFLAKILLWPKQYLIKATAAFKTLQDSIVIFKVFSFWGCVWLIFLGRKSSAIGSGREQ